jgi:hypothetical protein
MIELMLAEARQTELAVAEREQRHRREWYTFRAIERMETALRAARGRLGFQPATSAN